MRALESPLSCASSRPRSPWGLGSELHPEFLSGCAVGQEWQGQPLDPDGALGVGTVVQKCQTRSDKSCQGGRFPGLAESVSAEPDRRGQDRLCLD